MKDHRFSSFLQVVNSEVRAEVEIFFRDGQPNLVGFASTGSIGQVQEKIKDMIDKALTTRIPIEQIMKNPNFTYSYGLLPSGQFQVTNHKTDEVRKWQNFDDFMKRMDELETFTEKILDLCDSL